MNCSELFSDIVGAESEYKLEKLDKVPMAILSQFMERGAKELRLADREETKRFHKIATRHLELDLGEFLPAFQRNIKIWNFFERVVFPTVTDLKQFFEYTKIFDFIGSVVSKADVVARFGSYCTRMLHEFEDGERRMERDFAIFAVINLQNFIFDNDPNNQEIRSWVQNHFELTDEEWAEFSKEALNHAR